jgi:serine/threonine-protein kinase PknK
MSRPAEIEFPKRYEPLARLGKGGGGEVWAVRDRHTGRSYALKVLAIGASEREMAALVREAVALSGLEGLGLPSVMRFGRLPGSKRPFLVRDLIEGRSLEELIQQGAELPRTLDALARAADQLTLLHRAGLLHGDVKPANVIVQPSGATTLVDLGLAAPWREGGAPAEGLTPRYAAPELFEGKPLTVRAEVYALGVALAEALEKAHGLDPKTAKELDAISGRAIAQRADDRFPSVDEFASAVRRAVGLGARDESREAAALWPVTGFDNASGQLLEAVVGLGPGGVLRVSGPPGSGRSALLRRLAWSLGVQGQPLAWIDEAQADAPSMIEAELADHSTLLGVTVLVDDTDALDASGVARLRQAREAGARLVIVGGGGRIGEGAGVFEVPALDERAAIDLVRRAVPSLTETLQRRIIEVADGRPGELRRLVRLIAAEPVASSADIERVIGAPGTSAALPDAPLERAVYFLDRGRFNEARAALETALQAGAADQLALATALARLDLGLGEAQAALERLDRVRAEAEARRGSHESKLWALYLSRAHVGTGDYTGALELAASVAEESSALGAEGLAYQGVALSYLGRHDEAKSAIERAVEVSQRAGSARIEALAMAAPSTKRAAPTNARSSRRSGRATPACSRSCS